MEREMYHTQEKRSRNLTEPKLCKKTYAWLGKGYYYWLDLDDAHYWGLKSKNRTGAYQIYASNIDMENVLDTVYNEEHYLFWKNQIEKVAKKITISTGHKPTIKQMNEYLKERCIWDEVPGILFQDLPKSETQLMVKDFYYKKRIQLVVYDKYIILTFALLTEEEI